MIKSKKQMFVVISVFALVMLLGTITYAFFNYTRIGSANTIRVGRISFVSKNEQTINLTNLFPIDPKETGIMNDITKVGTYTIDIEGDTDYVGGIEYLVTTTDAHIYTSEGKMVPISIDVQVNNLGTSNSNYFTARNSKDTTMYKIMSAGTVVGEQQLVVGYIKPNTTSGTKEGVNGSITIKAYFDKNKIAITDTQEENTEWQEGRTVISTAEWNALQSTRISFKIKVEANEGIWVGEPFYEVMKRSAVMDNVNSTYVQNTTPGIDLSMISGDTNGKGIYTLSRTANDTYPIMYYRGDVDNNVLFGGFCWKVVRTTDTGGIKLIYNGNPVNNQCGIDRVIEKNQVLEFALEFYSLNSQSSVYYGDSYEYDSVNKVFRLTGTTTPSTWSEENSVNLVGKYTCFSTSASGTCYTLNKVHSYNSSSSVNVTQVTIDSSIIMSDDDINKDNVKFNSDEGSPTSVGYMYGTDYPIINGVPDNAHQVYVGTGFIYENGLYRLVNPIQLAPNKIRSTHHYTCNSTNPDATCESIRYYISFATGGDTHHYYIVLTNGDSIEDALKGMFTNTYDSLVKSMVDTWYRENMMDYTQKLEDTIYCNDRSIRKLGDYTVDDDYSLITSIEFSIKFGFNGMNCPNKNDSFTVSSEKGNGKLDYPIGLLTNDETELAGAIFGLDNPNTDFYLYDGNGYWTMTPNQFTLVSYVQRLYGGTSSYAGGNWGGTRVDHVGYMSGIRPVISLKEGTSVVRGTGTPTNPYVVE